MKARFIKFNNKSVKMTSVYSLFTLSEIQEILNLGVKLGCCHHNAFKIAELFRKKGVMYCEGLFTSYKLAHAWNRIGDKFFDINEVLNNCDFRRDYHKGLKSYHLKRLYSSKNITKVFIYEKNAFITFKRNDIPMDQLKDIYYDDSGVRQKYANAA